jgi:DNA-3-methyladenine glycosylase II
MTTFTLRPLGAFSLRESAEVGFGPRHSTVFDGTMRLAFCADDLLHQVGVAVTQDERGVHGAIVGPGAGAAPVDAVAAQTARMLSLDVDARDYEAVAARDPVVARVLATAPGLRPPLFHSPYEAAAWCVLSLRWNTRQAAAVRDRLAHTHGLPVEVAGVAMAAFPTPEQLLAVTAFDGVPPVKIERLHGVARAALDGLLSVSVAAAACDEGDGVFAACHRYQQDWGIPVRLTADGPAALELDLRAVSGLADVPPPATRS